MLSTSCCKGMPWRVHTPCENGSSFILGGRGRGGGEIRHKILPFFLTFTLFSLYLLRHFTTDWDSTSSHASRYPLSGFLVRTPELYLTFRHFVTFSC